MLSRLRRIFRISSMANATETPRRITHVIFDLDGTLLDTEKIVDETCEEFVNQKYGKKWDAKNMHRVAGKRPLDAAAAVVEDYMLPCTPEEFLDETTIAIATRWCKAKPLPGANRLLKHLSSHNIPFGLASNSNRTNITLKLSYQSGWAEAFKAVISGDEVKQGKPSPEIFLEASKLLNANPTECLVIEDSPTGVAAGKAAGMEVVAIPSIPTKGAAASLYAPADHILSSLLDFKPEIWGLPPFEDWVAGALPIEPWCIGGPVIKGYGRGSKMLGIPTANLALGEKAEEVGEKVSGVYIGWASVAKRGVFKMVMSVGWNPFFDNAEKTVEPWLLHEFGEDFYGEELRLVVVGYIRAEANFETLHKLIERIKEDGRIAKEALDVEPYSSFINHPYLIIN